MGYGNIWNSKVGALHMQPTSRGVTVTAQIWPIDLLAMIPCEIHHLHVVYGLIEDDLSI